MVKRIKVCVGDLFLIPRIDGKYVLGQVIHEWRENIICIAVLDVVVADKKIPTNFSLSDSTVISMPSVAKVEISRGYWPTFGAAPVIVDARLGPHYEFERQDFLGASWFSGKMIEDLVNAYYGLSTWEPYPGRPGHLHSMLFDQKQDVARIH
jgi:hypothetical protein